MPRCKTNPTSKGIHGCEMMEHLSCEKRLAEVGLGSLKERRPWGKAIEAFQHLTGAPRELESFGQGLGVAGQGGMALSWKTQD